MKRVHDLGGMIKAVGTGFIQREVSKKAYEFEKGIQKGEYIKVGSNKYNDNEEENKTDVDLHEYNEEWVGK